jgi:hypothetical protein
MKTAKPYVTADQPHQHVLHIDITNITEHDKDGNVLLCIPVAPMQDQRWLADMVEVAQGMDLPQGLVDDLADNVAAEFNRIQAIAFLSKQLKPPR